MDLSSGTSGMLLGIGLASLGVGVALKILKSVESEIVLKKEPPVERRCGQKSECVFEPVLNCVED